MAALNNLRFAIVTVGDRRESAEDMSVNDLKEIIVDGEIFPHAKISMVADVLDDNGEIEKLVASCCDVLKVNVLLLLWRASPQSTDNSIADMEGIAFKRNFWILPERTQVTLLTEFPGNVICFRGKTFVVSLPVSQEAVISKLKAIASLILHYNNVRKTYRKTIGHEKITDVSVIKSKVVFAADNNGLVAELESVKIDISNLPYIFKNFVTPLGKIQMRTEDASGFVLAKSVTSDQNIPHMPTSVIDGYAARIIKYDNDGKAIPFDIIGKCLPGGKLLLNDGTVSGEFKLVGLQAAQISVGNMVPLDTTCVTSLPNVTFHSLYQFTVQKPLNYLENIRETGSDVKAGELVVRRGTLLTRSGTGVLATFGTREIPVIRKPVVAIVSSHDELVKPWGPRPILTDRGTNKAMLITLLQAEGYRVIDLGIVEDDPDAVLEALMAGLASADVVISPCSRSMNQRDVFKSVLTEDLGFNLHFSELNVAPCERTGFGTFFDGKEKKYWFGIPGYPMSAFVAAHLVLLPALKMLSGYTSNMFQSGIIAEVGDIGFKKSDEYKSVEEYQLGYCSFTSDLTRLSTPVVKALATPGLKCDTVNFNQVNCLVKMPVGMADFPVRALIEVLLLN